MSLSEETKRILRQHAREREPYTIRNSAYETAISDGLTVEELREWGMPEERIAEIDGRGPVPGCTDPKAQNFNADATVDDGSCIYTSATSATSASRAHLAGNGSPCR